DLENGEDQKEEPADDDDPQHVALDVPVFGCLADREGNRRGDGRDRSRGGWATALPTGASLLGDLFLGEDRGLELGCASLLLGGHGRRRRGCRRGGRQARRGALERATLAGPGGEAGALGHERDGSPSGSGSGRRIASVSTAGPRVVARMIGR